LVRNPANKTEDVYLGQYDLKEHGTWIRLLKDCKQHKDAYSLTERVAGELFSLEAKANSLPLGPVEIVLKITYGDV